MNRLARPLVLLTGLGLVLIACETTIISDGDEDGGGGTGGDGGTTSSTQPTMTTGMQPPPPSPAISMLYSEWNDLPPPNGSVVATSAGGTTIAATTGPTTTGSGPATATVGTGTPHDPATLVIFLGSELQSCAAPGISECDADGTWDVTILLPPQLQTPGTYPLENLASWFEQGPCDRGGGGGGSYWDGTIQVTAVSAGEIAFTLSGTGSFFFVQGNADGSYVAPRCF
jgi:hypothetical protein